MEVKRLKNLVPDIFKTLNCLHHEYMKKGFPKTNNLAHRLLDTKVYQNNITKYGNKNLTSLRPHIWSSMPKQIKEETDYSKFKNDTDVWFSAKCKCNLCCYLR